MFNNDMSSILLLLVGKESIWTPYIIVCFIIFQKWNVIQEKIKSLVLINKYYYELSGKIYCNTQDAYTYGELSTYMWAVLFNIHKIIKNNNIKIKKAKTVQFPHNQAFETGEHINIPYDNCKIKLTDTIHCTIKMSNKDINIKSSEYDNKNISIETINLTIVLTSSVSIVNIIQYVTKVTDEYNLHVQSKNTNKLFIIKPSFNPKESSMTNTELEYPSTIPFKSKKTFDNLFFEGKELLINRLNTFKNRDKYSSLGLPETLGLLFYGEPGTGKTSAIKAVANYLQMHLIIVPMTHIKTKKRLEDLFFNRKLEDYPQEKRIYVFEEIDCNGWEDIVRDRRFITDTNNSSNNINDTVSSAVNAITDSFINSVAGSIDIKNKNKKNNCDDKLTLGAILEVIDGLVETPGRVIIFTTNHKEHLDPALLRPGRIDMQIEFKKLRRNHISEIYKKWYGHPINLKLLNNIPDYKFSQAEVSQLLFKHENDSNNFLNEITKVNT
jgi:hypothetical protein